MLSNKIISKEHMMYFASIESIIYSFESIVYNLISTCMGNLVLI